MCRINPCIVWSRTEYTTAILSSSTVNIDVTQINRLQAIQNVLARVVTKTPKHHHITPALKKLHWLKIPERIQYKAILTHIQHTSILPTLVLTSFVHHPTTSFNPILIHSNTTPPFSHLVTQIFHSLRSRSCSASLDQTPASIATNV